MYRYMETAKFTLKKNGFDIWSKVSYFTPYIKSAT